MFRVSYRLPNQPGRNADYSRTHEGAMRIALACGGVDVRISWVRPVLTGVGGSKNNLTRVGR